MSTTVQTPSAGWRAALDRPLVRFAVIGLALYALWFLLYELWLGPDARLDLAVSHIVAQGSKLVLMAMGYAATVNIGPNVDGVTSVFIWGRPDLGAEVTTGCNGLSSIALFAGFVLAYPGTWRRRAFFIPAGALLIFVLNALRIGALVVILDRWPQYESQAHALVAPAVFYVVVFVLWMLWVRYGGAEGPATTTPAAPAAPAAPATAGAAQPG